MIHWQVCSVCGRKRAGLKRGVQAIDDHIRTKHKGQGERLYRPEKGPRVEGVDDESMASRALQAELDRAMGVPNDDCEWLIP